jgi:hypothetical protein
MDDLDVLNDSDLFGDEPELPKGDTVKKDTVDNSGDNQNRYKKSGNKEINLFEEDPEPIPIDFKNMKTIKTFTIAVANAGMTLSDNEKSVLKKLLEKLKEDNYRIRIMCNVVTPIWDMIIDVFDNDDITIVKPWPKFCPVTDYRIILPKDIHKQNAAYHFKNFDKLPTAIKFINSALLATLFGVTGNEALSFVLVFDPFSTKDKIDFKQAKDSGSFVWVPRLFKDNSINVYNVAKADDIKNLVTILK